MWTSVPIPLTLENVMSPPKYLEIQSHSIVQILVMKGKVVPGVESGEGQSVAQPMHGRVGAGGAAHVAPGELHPLGDRGEAAKDTGTSRIAGAEAGRHPSPSCGRQE